MPRKSGFRRARRRWRGDRERSVRSFRASERNDYARKACSCVLLFSFDADDQSGARTDGYRIRADRRVTVGLVALVLVGIGLAVLGFLSTILAAATATPAILTSDADREDVRRVE
jgi:hypothetical protein